MRRESIVASVVIVASAWFYWQASFLPSRSADPLGPARYPQLIAIAMIIFALLHIVVSYFRRHRLNEEESDDLVGRARWLGNLRIAGVVVATGAYALVMDALGFTVSTFIYMILLMLMLGVRRVPSLALSSLGIAVFLVLLFAKFLGVLVPEGPVEELLLH